MAMTEHKAPSYFFSAFRSGRGRIVRIIAMSALAAFLAMPSPALCSQQDELSSSVHAAEKKENTPVHTFTESMQGFFRDVCQYFRTGYRWGGQSPAGFDCSGFVRFMYEKAFNMQLPRSAREMSAVGCKVQREELKPGDLVFFQTGKNGINHVGIFIGADTFIHSSLSKGITEDQLKENYYDKRYAGAVRILDGRVKQSIPSGMAPQQSNKEENS